MILRFPRQRLEESDALDVQWTSSAGPHTRGDGCLDVQGRNTCGPQRRHGHCQAPGAMQRKALLEGAVLAGRYRVVRAIASGGMGEVYEADDQFLQEPVALKTLRRDVADDSAAVKRFGREIALARKISHPSVCRILDVGVYGAGGGAPAPFFTMELLAGETLAAYLRRRGRLAPEMALPLIEQMAGGLTAAHRAGVIHRDFKTSNVMLALGGGHQRVVITDFGLAKGSVAAPAIPADGAALTCSGILGTPAYMAPEQVTGDAVDERADVYALGIVIFEMVAGRLPFVARTPLAMALRRVTQPPPSPATFVPDLDARWVAAILRCLARSPAERFASPAEVVRALRGDDVVAPRRPAAHPTTPRRASLAAVALVACICGQSPSAGPGTERRLLSTAAELAPIAAGRLTGQAVAPPRRVSARGAR